MRLGRYVRYRRDAIQAWMQEIESAAATGRASRLS
jgi:predicted DNA-binding transcriptional regulator AlpA